MDPRPPARRVPTGVLVAVVLALLALGATWWSGARPRPAVPVSASPSPPVGDEAAGGVLVLQMGDGTIVVDDTGATTLYRGMRQQQDRARPILGGQVPCRISGSASDADALGVGDLTEAITSGVGVTRMPRCGRPVR